MKADRFSRRDFLVGPAAAAAVLLLLGALHAASGTVLWRQASFSDFAGGVLEDGGANTYISARGAVQLANRWDYNNDGFIDLLFVGTHDHSENLNAFLYPNRDGDFRDQDAVPLPTDGGNWGLIQDLNADGFADIVIGNTDNGTIGDLDAFVYWGSKLGYSSRNRSEVPTIFAGRPAAGDLNKDGFADLVFPNGGSFLLHPGDQLLERGSYVYWGGKDGYRKDRRLELPTFDAKAAAVADFDGDGWLDIAFANHVAGGAARILIGGETGRDGGEPTDSFIYWGGSGGFSPAQRSGLRTDGATMLRVYDVDGDGKPDPVFLDRRGLVVYRNTGKRRFEMILVPGAKGARDFAIGDLNGDRKPDLVLAASPGVVAWGKGGASFSFEQAVKLPALNPRGCEIADFNGDGRPDIVFANHDDGRVYEVPSYIYWNSKDGFVAGLRRDVASTGAESVTVGDFNGDGRPDLLVHNTIAGHVKITPTYIYFGNERGEYSAANRREIEAVHANDGASADFNEDGFTDLVLTQGLRVPRAVLSGNLSSTAKIQVESDGMVEAQPVYWGDASLFFTLRTTYLPMFGSYGASVADLNRDGHLDLVLSGYFRRPGAKTDVSRIFYGGPGGFSADRIEDLEAVGAEPSTIADFNRDGWLDIVFPNRKTGMTDGSILYFGGPKGFAKNNSVLLPTANTTRSQAADLDGDGWLELIFSNQIEFGSQFTPNLIYWGGPEGFALQRRTELPGWGGYGVCVADYNRDGYLDLAIPSYKGYRSRKTDSKVYWGGPEGYYETNYTHLPTDSGAECMAADFNADGWTDLLILNHRKDGAHQVPGRPGTHNTNSFLYWSGAGGFLPKPLEIPSSGAHCNNSVDYGNIYNRRLQWGYTSPAFEFGDRAPSTIHWEAKTPFHTFVRFQVRTAAAKNQLSSAAWRGPSADAAYYTRPGEAVGALPAGHRWVQYRFELGITRGTGNPEVTAVEFRTR